MVTRRNLLKIGGITAAGLLTQGSVRKHSRPNILFVFTDQQTWRAMSCAGIPLLPSFRGRSLKAIIDNPKTKWRDYVVTELADDKLDPSRKARMVWTAQYKYNVYSSGARRAVVRSEIRSGRSTESGVRTFAEAHSQTAPKPAARLDAANE